MLQQFECIRKYFKVYSWHIIFLSSFVLDKGKWITFHKFSVFLSKTSCICLRYLKTHPLFYTFKTNVVTENRFLSSYSDKKMHPCIYKIHFLRINQCLLLSFSLMLLCITKKIIWISLSWFYNPFILSRLLLFSEDFVEIGNADILRSVEHE